MFWGDSKGIFSVMQYGSRDGVYSGRQVCSQGEVDGPISLAFFLVLWPTVAEEKYKDKIITE